MATGPSHYAEAEKLICESRGITADDLDPAQLLMAVLAEAQARATLALAAATALAEGGMMPGAEFDAWADVCATQPIPAVGQTRVWWLDDGHENPGAPRLYTSETAARAAAVKQYTDDNPGRAREVTWLPVDEDDNEIELAADGRRTGIIVRPVRPQDAA